MFIVKLTMNGWSSYYGPYSERETAFRKRDEFKEYWEDNMPVPCRGSYIFSEIIELKSSPMDFKN